MRPKLSRLWFSTLCLTAVAVIGMTLFGIWRSGQGQNFCALKTVQIQSRFEHLSAEQIRAAIKSELAAGFFGLDLVAVRSQLKALPWVAQVEVRKHWPVSGAGAMHGLVHLSGPDSRRQELVSFYRSSEPMLRNLSLHMTKARFSKRGALTLQLSDASKIILGREQQMQRWQRFVENLPTLRAKNQGLRLLEIDLRYTNGLAARFAPPAANEVLKPLTPPRAQPQTPNPESQPAARLPSGPALLANFGSATNAVVPVTAAQTQSAGATR